MKSIGISEFKAKCIAILKRAHRTHTPLVVTLRGKPLVRIEPLPAAAGQRRLGAFVGQGRIHGDIVELDLTSEWEMER